LVLTGESGMGKSSLLANFYLRETERLRLEHPEFFAMTEEERRRDIRMDYPPLIILHFIGATPQSAKAINIVRRVMALMRQHFGLLMSIPDRDDDVIRGSLVAIYLCHLNFG
jgi:ABC-type phosphonate transport system ATPase subunit